MINLQPINLEYSGNIGVDTSGKTHSDQMEDLDASNTVFNTTLLLGFLALFIAVTAVGVLSGLNISIFGSTVQISERSQRILFISMFYLGLWGIFSTLATVGINGIGLFSIETWGALFYLFMTLIYIIGLSQLIEGGGK